MAKVVTDDKHYKAIADKLRERSEGNFPDLDRFPPSEMPARIHAVCDINRDSGYGEGHGVGHTEGYSEGVAEGRAQCAAQHFATTVHGDGGGSISVKIPFEPDTLCILGSDPLSFAAAGGVLQCNLDLRAFGFYGGGAVLSTGENGAKVTSFTTNTMLSRYSRSEDGTVTLQNLDITSSSLEGVFAQGASYVLIASKYTDLTDNDRITAFVNGLTGSGTVTLNQAKVETSFTGDEWANLIYEKQGWTFNWI